MFSFWLILVSAMLVTCLNGLETSCGQSNHDEIMFNKLIDIECRLKQVETILDKFVSVDISWKQEPTMCASTTSSTTTSPKSTPTTTSPPKCLENWISFQQSCYLFIENLVDFNSAVEQCKSLSSHLVYAENVEENTFIKNYLMNNGTDYFWWIGLTDNEKEGTWKWLGTDRITTFTNWGIFQPDNQGGNENCAAYTWWVKYDWNDAPCSLQYNVICEKELF